MAWTSPSRQRTVRAAPRHRKDLGAGPGDPWRGPEPRTGLGRARWRGTARARGVAGCGLVATVSCATVAVLTLPAAPWGHLPVPHGSTSAAAASAARPGEAGPAGRAASPAARPIRAPAHPPATAGGDNGIERQSARQIADKSGKALQSASALRARLNDRAARHAKQRPMTTDLRLDRSGNCRAGLTYANGGNVALVKRGKQVWLRPNDIFWKTQIPGRTGRAAASFLNGRFVHGTTSSAFLQEAARLCDMNSFRKEIITATTGASGLHKGRTTSVGGTRAVPLSGRRSGRATTVFVSAQGTPFPLKATVRGGQTDVVVTLTDYNKPVPSKTPPSSDSVDVAKLEAKLSGR